MSGSAWLRLEGQPPRVLRKIEPRISSIDHYTVLGLLHSDVYDEAQPPVLDKVRKMVSEVEHDGKHLERDLLGDLTPFVRSSD